MKKRYIEFDIARVIALVLMPLAHITEASMNSGLINESTFTESAFILKIASLGVFVFMCMLGVNILLTGHNTASDFAKRGGQMLLLGVALNIARYIIPGILGAVSHDNMQYILRTFYYSIASDILYFSAICFFFFALSKKFNFKWYLILIIGCVFNLLDFYLPTPVIHNDILGAILGNFTYINEDSAFSATQWLVVVCVGYAFGTLYLKCDNKSAFYKKSAVVSLAFLVATIVVCKLLRIEIFNEIGCQYENYNLSLIGVFVLFLVYLFLQSIVYFISVNIKNAKIIRFIVAFSKGITVYYILQWIIVCWASLILGIVGFGEDRYLSCIGLMVCGILIIVASTVLTLLFQRNRAAKKKDRNTVSLT